MKKDVGMILMAFAVTISLGVSAITWWHEYHRPRIVSVDLLYLSDRARVKFQNPEDIKAFSRKMEASIRKLADTHHWMIVPRQVAVAGVPDITAMLAGELL